MSRVKLEETDNRRRLHIGSYFVDLNESEYQELVRIFSDQSRKAPVIKSVCRCKEGKQGRTVDENWEQICDVCGGS